MRRILVLIALFSIVIPAGAQVLERADRMPALESVLKLDSATSRYLLPVFVVDRTNPGGQTTLMGIVNGESTATPVAIAYSTRGGLNFRNENRTIPPNGTLTINLRDVPGLPVEPDNFSRGYATVMAAPGTRLAGDFFHIDPAQNFSQGERLIDLNDGPFCPVWSFRFAVGGVFSGGTTLTVVTNLPLGTSQPSVVFEVRDEGGASYGLVTLTTTSTVERVRVSDILAQLPSAPVFGSLQIGFVAGTGGGIILGEWNASGRFQVGFNGTCMQ
jgi:hypothetical protein